MILWSNKISDEAEVKELLRTKVCLSNYFLPCFLWSNDLSNEPGVTAYKTLFLSCLVVVHSLDVLHHSTCLNIIFNVFRSISAPYIWGPFQFCFKGLFQVFISLVLVLLLSPFWPPPFYGQTKYQVNLGSKIYCAFKSVFISQLVLNFLPRLIAPFYGQTVYQINWGQKVIIAWNHVYLRFISGPSQVHLGPILFEKSIFYKA